VGTAVEARLGPIEQVHRARRGLRRLQLAVALTLAAAAVLAWVVAGYRAFTAYTEVGPLLIGRWANLPALLGAGLGCAALWLGVGAWRTAQWRVRRHANGLVVVRGRRGRALAWPDVRALWSRAERTGLTSSRRLRLEVEASDGRRIHLDDRLEDFEALAARVKEGVYPRLLESYARAFNDRQPLTFGPIHLGPTGIEAGRQPALEWKEVNGAELAEGRLRIHTTRTGRRSVVGVAAARVPNVELCAQLIQEIGHSA